MKKLFTWLPIVVLALFMSCGQESGPEGKKQFPQPGTVVAHDSIPVPDALNNFVFSVKVIADSEVTSGVYDVDADFGPNFATSKFTMPKGAEDLKPLIKRGNAPLSFIIGFKVPNDTTFYDYFEVSSDRHNTKMQYIKAYTF